MGTEVDKCKTKAAKLRMLEDRVANGTSGMGSKADPNDFAPSSGHSVGDRLSVETLTATCIKKGIRTNAPACRISLYIYGKTLGLGRGHEI